MRNQTQLITYVDRLGGGGLRELAALLNGPLAGLFGGVHLLPFFDPIDGADAGFDPIDHTRVDPRLGAWADVRALGARTDVMADLIVNHVSARSSEFRDFVAHGDASHWAGLFLTRDSVFPGGAAPDELARIYRPRPGAPFTDVRFASGETRALWTTFTSNQIDIDVHHPAGREYLLAILDRFASSGVRAIRLDAAGYAIKKRGTSCFMLPETFAFIREIADRAHERGIEVLVEIHSHVATQVTLAKQVDWIYDFALPPLVLHALCHGTAETLKHWIRVRPRNCFTVLDTHDGIGIVDIGADGANLGLVPPAELDRLVEYIHERSDGHSRRATGAHASNLDLYQINCTYFDACGRDAEAYLAARALQLFLPGVPQIYYVGLLGGTNDMALLARTGVGRDINRHYYTRAEIDSALASPLVQRLCDLIRLRNSHPAFNGEFELLESPAHALRLRWTAGRECAELAVDLCRPSFAVTT
ncbi:MAG: sucrose phosphorylase [Gammaproteobacteria bacterium]